MQDINHVTFTGRLAGDPELRHTNSEHAVSTLRVAIQRPNNRDGGDRGAVFYDVEVWNATAENCVRYLSKGSRIAVAGRLEHDQWTDDHGVRRQRSYVVARQVNFLDPAPRDSAGGEEAEAEPVAAGGAEDDIPI